MREKVMRPTVFGTMLCVSLLAVAGGRLWWLSAGAAAPSAAQKASRLAHPQVGTIYGIAPNLYVIPGGGGNTAVFVTTHGVVLVDTKYADRYDAMIREVRTVTDKPITHVINTHSHGDHMGGNQFLPPGVEIVVQDNTARNMEVMRPSWDPNNEHARPLRTYKDTLTLFSGDEAIDLYCFGPAHTNGDTFVVFRAAGVLHAGDVFPDKVAPIINIAWGGNGLTFADTVTRAASEIQNVTYVIPGHGPVRLFSDFVDYGDFYRRLLAYAEANPRAGHGSEQLARELDLPDRFKSYNLQRVSTTLDEIYSGLTQHDAHASTTGDQPGDDR